MVALDADGRPSFNLLQNYGTASVPLAYFVFDVMVLRGRSVMSEPLSARRTLLESKVLPTLRNPVRYLGPLEVPLCVLVQSAKAQGFEGLVAKRIDSRTSRGCDQGLGKDAGEPRAGVRDRRATRWVGTRSTRSSSVTTKATGCCTPREPAAGSHRRRARTCSSASRGSKRGCVPSSTCRRTKSGRWGEGLTAKKMAECRWLLPRLVGQFEFLEWTADGHLRHTRFVGLRDDTDPRRVVRERESGSSDDGAGDN